MSYTCPKEMTAEKILAEFGEDDLDFTLASCEQTCDRYYQCDYVALMEDLLKEKQGEE